MRPSPFAAEKTGLGPSSGRARDIPATAIPAEYVPRRGVDPLSRAFDKKVAVHAGLMGAPRVGREAADTLRERMMTPRTGKSAAYVHVPFCETRCLYCGFFGGKYSREKGDAYVDALLAQLAMDAELPAAQAGPVHALYLGGGTPTALSATQLERLLGALVTTLPLANDCEITVEGRIHNFGEDKMRACIEAGVNRFSLGVQSFDTGLRRRLGRIDGREAVIAAIEKLAAFDQAVIVTDLIYGLPGQTLRDWEADVRLFLSLPLDGVDLYQLNVFPGGKLHDGIRDGSIPPVPDIAGQSAYFARGVEIMRTAGMRRLSMSHWGKGNRERNMYNPLTKSRADCLAYGAGAGGTMHGHLYIQESDPEKYMESMARGEKPVAMLMDPPEHFGLMRVVLGQMENGFLDLDDVAAAGGSVARGRLEPLLAAWEEGGAPDPFRLQGESDPGRAVLECEPDPVASGLAPGCRLIA